MTKNVFILDEYISSANNGIGTYLRELIYCLQCGSINVNLIRFNVANEEFVMGVENGIRTMLFPAFSNADFRSQFAIIDKFFRLYIKDSEGNIFILNHSPCEKLIKQIKLSFPLSKVVFVIHDFGWTRSLLGNSIKLKEIIDNKIQFYTNTTYQYVIDYFEEEKRMYVCVDKIICLSQNSYDLLISNYGVMQEKIELIPNGLQDRRSILNRKEKNKIRESLYLQRNEKIILFVGRPNIAKGIFAILRCFEEVLKQKPFCRLVVIGAGGASEYLLSKCSAYSRISFTGRISQAELERWYKIADIGIIASYTEQCSFAGIEMMMYGLPIVASDGFGLRNMFQDEVNAKIAKIGDVNEEYNYGNNLSQIVLALLNSEKSMNKLRKGGRLVYEEKYGIDKMRARYCKLINSL